MPEAGKKFDQLKAKHDLLPYEALDEIAKVLSFGADRYGRFNWQNGIEYSRLISAAYRHLGKFNNGEDINTEDGNTLHLANAACNLLFLIWMTKHKPELDDRSNAKTKGEIGARVSTEPSEVFGVPVQQTQETTSISPQAAPLVGYPNYGSGGTSLITPEQALRSYKE